MWWLRFKQILYLKSHDRPKECLLDIRTQWQVSATWTVALQARQVDERWALQVFGSAQEVWQGVEESARACWDTHKHLSAFACLKVFSQAWKKSIHSRNISRRSGLEEDWSRVLNVWLWRRRSRVCAAFAQRHGGQELTNERRLCRR